MDDIKSRIVSAARALYFEREPDAVTMRAVAERVGVTATALYRHFADKDAILREVMGEGSRLLGSHLFRALEAPTPLERLRATANAYLDFAVAQPQAYRALFKGAEPEESSPIQLQRGAMRRFLRDRVREAMDAGVLAPGDPDGTALSVWATLHGLASLHQAGITRVEWVREQVLTNLIEGVRASNSVETG
ncbi:TetR/AcrR family transcriptional regulator [Longimicrobium sp.]|uniref:TetR/AcrR family transcriptional regulator n=1 Tax=Longimicrobium sp. TaxID=2029185 RepID=UPI002E3277D0|nr:TetR/AcrR family transcriptional regulator [Longimicrobium sp.]HEX6039538.1 TetR/AcrR family transcriptional regulator [Longimicrobium sp.]